MKPKTRLEKEVADLSKQLPPLTEKQREWARQNATAHIAFLNKHSVWCSECGSISECDAEADSDYVCPCCGAHLKVCKSRKQKNEDKEYVSYITTIGGYQVLRHFLQVQNSYRGKEPFIFFDEVVQEWIAPDGRMAYVAKRRNMCGYYSDCWIHSSDLEIRNSHSYGYSGSGYNIYANYIYPHMKVLPLLKRNGFRTSFHNCIPSLLFSSLLNTKGDAEWLLKSKQYAVLSNYLYYGGLIYRDSVKICIRNHYTIKDVAIWKDYLRCLEYFHMDLHNAHYVCPKDLKKAHDYWMKRKERAEDKRRAEERRKEAIRWEAQYAKDKAKFIGIEFCGNGINVSVLPSVAAFVEEGEHMHHCVYSNGYYKESNSLILSAKDDEGKRLETIEVNLKTFSIVQCYGACNKFTPQHEQIKELVNQNMNLIRKAV